VAGVPGWAVGYDAGENAMKKVLILLVALGLLAVAGVYLVLGNLGGLIKGVVEKVGTDATQSPVTLAAVDISLSEGSGELKGLVIGNPGEFKSDYAMSLGLVRVKFDTSTLNSDPIVIKEIIIEGPQVIYEVALGSTNIGTIQENVAAYAAGLGAGGGGTDEPDAGDSESAEGRKVVIEKLLIRNTRVAVSASFLGGKDVGATIPEIHLADIGKRNNGATAGEVAAKVIDAISDAVIDTVADLDVKGLSDALQKHGGGLLDEAGKGLKGLLGGGDD
jgi:hypothetical protein